MPTQYDAIILRNQRVASEGVLPYIQKDGSILWKAKKWDNLRNFVNVRLPVIDEHPRNADGSPRNVNSRDRIYGYGTLVQCPNDPTALCVGTMELDDDAPRRRGYSLQYDYVPRPEQGTLRGRRYDLVQLIQTYDHIALTDSPRDPSALASVDSFDGERIVGFDSFTFAGNHRMDFCERVEAIISSDVSDVRTLIAEIRAIGDTVHSTTLEECVQKMIPHLLNKHPDFTNEQAVAVAYKQCREKHSE